MSRFFLTSNKKIRQSFFFPISLRMMMMTMIVPLFYMWTLCSTMDVLTKTYFDQNSWFNHGNIFHIDQNPFWNVFQQHRNVNRQ